ncbi:hypothetical protein [Paenibacillus ferrarius]|uniref:hypothetical protein n=1 Tax=Paenibacillus ferrarius TaxID=1469647 RepID=UPI003D2713FB
MASLNDNEEKSDLSFSFKQAVGSLITAFEKVGYDDAMDVAAIILEFENQLQWLPLEDAEAVFNERWDVEKNCGKKLGGIGD